MYCTSVKWYSLFVESSQNGRITTANEYYYWRGEREKREERREKRGVKREERREMNRGILYVRKRGCHKVRKR